METDEDSGPVEVDVEDLMGPDLLPVLQAAGDVVMSIDGTFGRTVEQVIEDLLETEYHDAGHGRIGVDAQALARLMQAMVQIGVLTD